MDENKVLLKAKSFKELALGMAAYSGASILGPLVFFILLGFLLDKLFNTKPLCIICGVIIAFIVTNIFIYKKIKKLIKTFDESEKQKKS